MSRLSGQKSTSVFKAEWLKAYLGEPLVSRLYVSFTRIASRFKNVGTQAVLAHGTAGGGSAAPAGKLCLTEVWDQSWAATLVPCPREHP